MAPADLRLPIALIVGGVALAVLLGGLRVFSGRTRAVWAGALAGWLVLTGGLAAAGALDVPLMPALIVIALASAVVVARSRLGERLAGLPLVALVGLQAFRLPLELAMHHGAGRGVPIELTFAGYNYDIITGASALVLAPFAGRAPAWLIRAWCAVGLACLAAIGIVAVATMPPVHAFGTDPAHLNTWIAHAPFVWVPTLLVPVALAGHLVVLRAVGRDRRSRGAAAK